jgi:hypothetical protein
MLTIRFRIRTIMIAICALAIILVAVRICAHVLGISGMSVGTDASNIPALFLDVTRPITLYNGQATLRDTITYSLRDIVAPVAMVLAGPMAVAACSRAVRIRRAKLDRQFAMQEHVDSDDRGRIIGLAQCTGPNTTLRTDESGEPKIV